MRRDEGDHKSVDNRARRVVGFCPQCGEDVPEEEIADGNHKGQCKGCPIQLYVDEEKQAEVAAAAGRVREAAERLIEGARKHVTLGHTHPHTPIGLFRELHAVTTALDDMQQGLLDVYRAEWNLLEGGRRIIPPRDYYIVDLKRTRVSDGTVFWRAEGKGYTMDMNDAGRYSREEAKRWIGDTDSVAIPVDAFNTDLLVRVMPKSGLEAAQERQVTYEELWSNRRPRD
jgi:hypothetical protein